MSSVPSARSAGVLPMFRLFAGLQLAPVVTASAFFFGHDDPAHPEAAFFTMTGLLAVLCVMLCVPWSERRMGGLHLPLTLALALATPFVVEVIELSHVPSVYAKVSAEVSVSLVFPLVVLAWRYGARPAVLAAVLAGVLDLILSFQAVMSDEQREIQAHVLFIRSLGLALAANVVGKLAARQRREQESLETAHAELARAALQLEELAATRERNRIARDLHDTLAHTLSGMAVQLEAMRALWDSDRPRTRSMLDASLATARSGLTETRRALQALRATPLDTQGLLPALRALAEGAAQRAGLTLTVRLPAAPPALPPLLEQGIYRFAQEALENVVRHSAARSVEVSLEDDGQAVVFGVADDGRGFDASRVGQDRFGLRGLRERAMMMGGALEIESRPGMGAMVRVSVARPPRRAVEEGS